VSIANVFEDSSGVVWVAARGGIDRLDGDKFVAAFRAQDHRGVIVGGESPLGDLYVALEGLGVGRLKDGKLMGVANLNGTQIRSIQQDLWIAGGSGGVVRVGAASLRRWEGEQEEPIDFTEFGRADGLLSKEGTGGYPNMTTTKDGKLWVATLGGVAELDVARLSRAAGKAFEYISQVNVDGKKRNAGRELILPPGLHHTELQLGSIELSSPERARIQYRLEGIDSGWLDAKPDGAAVYTTIPHGSYLLHVRASNGDGFWDRQGIVYRITQEPFFYETAAFRILMIVAGCMLVTGAYGFRLRQESARMKVRLEERVAERERIARELHDTMLQSLQASLAQMQAARNLFSRRSEHALQNLDDAITMAAGAVAEGRNAVTDLRSPAATRNDLAEALKALGDELAAGAAAKFQLVVEGSPQGLHPVIQDEICRIGGEALRNAFRHARAQHIEVDVRYSEELLGLQIRDDGIGITPEILEGGRSEHYGLAGMRERAEKIGAKLEIWSAAGTGTEIDLSLLAARAYRSSPPPPPQWLFTRE
jgi:signal transduction histidine kinase